MSTKEVFNCRKLGYYEAIRTHRLMSGGDNLEDWYIFFSQNKKNWMLMKCFPSDMPCYPYFQDELNYININTSKELRGTGLKLEFCEDFEDSISSIPHFGALVYFVDDANDVRGETNPFRLDEELLLRK